MRNALLGSIAVWLTGAHLLWAQPAHLVRQPLPEAAPMAPSGAGAASPSTTPDATTAGGITPDPNAPPLPWMPDWVNELFGSSVGQITASAEYLAWFNKNIPSLPPLVTTSRSAPEQGDVTLAGGTGASIDFHLFSGGRVSLGYFAGECQTCGLETTWFLIARQSNRFREDSASFLGRQFFNIDTGTEDAFIVSFPDVASGTVNVVSSSQTWGAEVNYWRNIINEPIIDQFRLDILVGFRYLDLSEDVSIISTTRYDLVQTTVPSLASFAGNTISAADRFGTDNQFFGAQTGFSAKYLGDFGILDFRVKLGLGDNHETINNTGGQVRTFANGTTVSSVGGVLVQRSNLGRFSRDQFIVVPETSLSWVLALTKFADIKLAYTFIFMSHAIRPGMQIDRAVDPAVIPNFGAGGFPVTDPTRPGVPFLQSNYYAHGVSAGLIFHW